MERKMKQLVKETAKKKIVKAKKTTAKATAKVLVEPPPAEIQMGDKVSDLKILSTSGDTLRLGDLKGKVIVLYFYPKDDTPGCTLEGQDFSKLHSKFKKKNTEVFGISRDSIASHEKFKKKMGFRFDLLSDPEEVLCRKLGVMKIKSLYGRKYLGVDRSTFVIDKNGVLVREWRTVKVAGHADEVLEFVNSLD